MNPTIKKSASEIKDFQTSRICFKAVFFFSFFILLQFSVKAQPGTVLNHQKISDTEGNFTGILDDGDAFGIEVDELGDLDNDGVTDLIVGAMLDDDGGPDRGAAWILFLNANGTVKAHQKISQTQGGFGGLFSNGALYGIQVAGIGDWDNDGIPDAAIGGISENDGNYSRGGLYLLMLNTNGTVKSHMKVSAITPAMTPYLQPMDFFGQGIEVLGDLNGDGIKELAVGAIGDGANGHFYWDQGAFYILSMNGDGVISNVKKIGEGLANFNADLETDDIFGESIANMGDLDGDGIVDLAVGARGDDDGNRSAGAVYILFMNSNLTVKSYQKISNHSGNFPFTLDYYDFLGAAVENVGDQNGDGINDIAVGAQSDDDGQNGSGAVYILFLNQNGTVNGGQKVSLTEGRFQGVLNEEDEFGISITVLNDLDGNGRKDIAVGSWLDDDGGQNRGAVWILFLGEDNYCIAHAGQCGIIQGKMFTDANSNCNVNPGEYLFTGAWVRAQTPAGFRRYTQTDSLGNYSFNLPPGSYSIRPVQLGWNLNFLCNNSPVLLAANQVKTKILAVAGICSGGIHAPPSSGADSCITNYGEIILRPEPCPDSAWKFCAQFVNNGTEPYIARKWGAIMELPDFPNFFGTYSEGAEINGVPYDIDVESNDQDFGAWDFWYEFNDTDYLTSYVLNPGDDCVICDTLTALIPSPAYTWRPRFSYTCDTIDLINCAYQDPNFVESYQYCTQIQPVLVDPFSFICGCDPNNLQRIPEGCGPNHNIAREPISYKVNFENVGTGPAFNVYVNVHLDSDLDVANLAIMNSSDPYTYVINGDVLEITFPNINLPSNKVFPGEGKGFIEISLMPRAGIPDGTEILSYASIVFDNMPSMETNVEFNHVFTNPSPVVDLGQNLNVDPAFAQTRCVLLTPNVIGGVPPYTYQWSNGATSSTITVCPASNTVYQVTVTDALGGCKGTDSVGVRIISAGCGNNNSKVLICHNGQTICVSPNAVPTHLAHGDRIGPCGMNRMGNTGEEENILLKAVPNPFDNQTNIYFQIDHEAEVTVEVFNLVGVRVAELFSGNVNENETLEVKFDSANLPEGNYLLKLTEREGRVKVLRLQVMR